MEEKSHYIKLRYLQSILHIRRLIHSLILILRSKLYLEIYLDQKTVQFNYWITRHGDIGLLNIHTSFIYFCTYSTSNHELEYWFVNFISYTSKTYYINGYDDVWIFYHISDCRTDQCDCKENVEGRQCDRCKGGFFGLLPNHPNGCLSCW